MMVRNGGKEIIYFNCQKPGHFIAKCPKIKNKPSSSNKASTSKKPFKKKAFKAT